MGDTEEARCIVCDLIITKGKQKVLCVECDGISHRTCQPKMSSTAFAIFKLSWKCANCSEGADSSDPETDNVNNIEENVNISFSNSYFNQDSIHQLNDSHQANNYECQLPPGLKYAHLNVNGVKGKFVEIAEFLNNEKNILVLGLTESKLDPIRDSASQFQIPNYNMLRYDRISKEGGGQLLYLHSSCDFFIIDAPIAPPNFVECSIISIHKHGIPTFIVCVLYVPPYDVKEPFFEFFNVLCAFLRQQERRVIIMGDLNINLLEKSINRHKLLTITSEFGYFELIKEATRVASVQRGDVNRVTSTLIDHMFTDNITNVASGVINVTNSDHFMTYVVYKKKKVTCPPKVIECRNLKKIDEERFEKQLESINWDFLKNDLHHEINFEIFEKQVCALLDTHAPIRKITVSYKTPKWLTSEIRIKIKERDKIAQSVRNGDLSQIEVLKKMKNKINIECRTASKNYYTNNFSKLRDSVKIWDLFDEITNFRKKQTLPISKLVTEGGCVVDKQDEIYDLLVNEYIVLGSSSNMKDIQDEVEQYENTFDYETTPVNVKVTPGDVISCIKSIKKCKPDNSGVPKQVYKKFAVFLVVPLCILFNSVIRLGRIPASLKKADCFPLFKGKGRLSQASSYRAIFNVPCVTKIFERLIYNRLLSYCKDKLDDNQHGFRAGRSCETAISQFTQDMFNILDQRSGKGVAVFIDFKKAFDSVDRSLLIRKLMNQFCVPPYLIKIMCSLFTDRKFKIINGDLTSRYYELNNGVCPGSCLGPLTFTLFINDLGDTIDLPYKLYADDAVIYTDCTDFETGIRQIQDCLIKLEEWCSKNNLTINVDKTKSMYFYKNGDRISKEKCTQNAPTFKINGINVEIVTEFKYLGIIVDSCLSFNSHFKNVEIKMNGALRKLYGLRRLMSENVLKIFMSSFVISIIDYGINIWCVKSDVEILRLQRKIDRFLLTFYANCWFKNKKRKQKSIDVMDYYVRLDLLTIIERRKYMLCKFVYKFRRNSMFKVWFKLSSGATETRPKIISITHNTKHYERSILWNAITEWNLAFSNRKVAILTDIEEFNFFDVLKDYLIQFRSNIYFMYTC